VEFSRKTFEADKQRRMRLRDRAVQTLLADVHGGAGAPGGGAGASAAGSAGGGAPGAGRGGAAGSAAAGRSASAASRASSSDVPPEQRLQREKRSRAMESFAAFFAELDDPAADNDVALMHTLAVREVDAISFALPSYDRDRFRGALDHDGVPVAPLPYERDLVVFEITTLLSADAVTRFNAAVDTLLAAPGGAGGVGAGFAQYCAAFPHDAVAQRMRFINASRNPMGRNVRFMTPIGGGLRRVELRLAQVAAHTGGGSDSDLDEDAADSDLTMLGGDAAGAGAAAAAAARRRGSAASNADADAARDALSPAAALSGASSAARAKSIAAAAAAAGSPRGTAEAATAAADGTAPKPRRARKTRAAAGPTHASGQTDQLLQRIQNKDAYTLYFTDL
jgi:hypothetical protein